MTTSLGGAVASSTAATGGIQSNAVLSTDKNSIAEAIIDTDRRRSSDNKRRKVIESCSSSSAAVAMNGVNGVSAKYDPSIVFAIDEILTRGAYSILAKWFVTYANVSDLPGCIVVVGYDRGCDSNAKKKGETCFVNLGAANTVNNNEYRDHEDDSDIGCNVHDDFDTTNYRVPIIRLNATLEYPIFEFKRCTGYPIVTILLTLRSSRMAHALSCDGRIEVDSRESMQRSFRRIAEAVGHVTDRYLKDLYYDETRGGNCFLQNNRRTYDCGDGGVGDDDKIDTNIDNFESDQETASNFSTSVVGVAAAKQRKITTEYDLDEYPRTMDELYNQNSPPYDSHTVGTWNVFDGSLSSDVEPGIPMNEMLLQNKRILWQSRNVDKVLRAESLYPNEGDKITVLREST